MRAASANLIVVMGVAGSGKTRVGTMLADALSCAYLDADSLHSPASIDMMRRGVPLTDADRAPWLAAVRARLVEAFALGRSIVVSCSALRQSYRAFLAEGLPITWVHLRGSEELIRSRLQGRAGHFFPADMLGSQVQTLEEPRAAIVVDITAPPDAIVAQILDRMRLEPELRVFANEDDLSEAAAEAVSETIVRSVRAAGRCSLILAGGSTPRPLYSLLATRYRELVPWPRVHVFWGDERYVPPDDERSNYRLARETLLDRVPCPPANIHPMPTGFADPDDAARAYEATLRDHFAGEWPRFDLVLLGMGSDGHTASLFPGAAALAERTRWVLPVTAPAEPPSRITLTLPVLNRSAHTYLLVTGTDKAEALQRVVEGQADPSTHPAAAIRPPDGEVVWWVDGTAAARLHRGGDAAAT